ncbi:transposase [Chitinophagaceae bacterium 26-R-25]|nr:transposase [Chitinophagaceae bacterium 26-R-25]
MKNMFTEGFRIRDQFATHFLTFTVEGWIDIFSRQRYRDIILESFKFCIAKKGLRLHAYVIMSNHVHVIWTATEKSLSDIMRDFKTFTSKEILRSIADKGQVESRRDWLLYMFEFFGKRTNANDKYKLWSGNNHPEIIYSVDFMRTKLDYIHNNPVRAGIVQNPSDYLYSSASNYEGKSGLIEMDLLY